MTGTPVRTPAATARTWRRCPGLPPLPPLLRLLIWTQLAFNIGFYAVLPFLAEHLGTAIGMAGWLVGLVLGLRTFSQQGLFVVGGALADRYGIRPVVLAGCALRIAGFAWLGWAERTWAVIGAVLLIGFAAALFSPAVESEVARQAVRWEEAGGGPRTRVLALFSVAGQAGAFVGPLLGALLLAVDFRAVCLAGAGVFVLVLAGHLRLLPQHIPGRKPARPRGGPGRVRIVASDQPAARGRPQLPLGGAPTAVAGRGHRPAVAGGACDRKAEGRPRTGRTWATPTTQRGGTPSGSWEGAPPSGSWGSVPGVAGPAGLCGHGLRTLARNRRFLALCLAYGVYLLAYNQLYLALPLEVERAVGSQAPLAWLFALSSALVVTAQLPVTRWAAARLDLRRSMAAGLLLVSAGFAAVAAARPAAWTGAAGLLPAAGLVVLLTLGQMLLVPAARAWVPDLAEEGRLGLYTGALSSVSGLVVLAGSAATGSLLDAGLPAAVPWLVLAALPPAAVALLPRHRGGPPEPPAPTASR
ncbi:MFS transporter [Streptomyces lonegramiae]|uniref:MFS transporter n=1 Tax=Streptomyces lonegramiae TaxID=3075524 RepID=A0ABU2X9T1_9ACTN|nr:MFS transporter [Streptomyces sp. DSM 41529]MDT0542677.1 MFS transporter [Streptomyces sp. DSM 41529]